MAVYAVGNLIVAREERERPGAGGQGRIEYQHKELPVCGARRERLVELWGGGGGGRETALY